MNMYFGANKTPVELKKGHLEDLILEICILMLMTNSTESHGKNELSWRILIKSIIAQIISVCVNKCKVKCGTHH